MATRSADSLISPSDDAAKPNPDTLSGGGVGVLPGSCQSLAEATVTRLRKIPRAAWLIAWLQHHGRGWEWWSLQKFGASAFWELQNGFPLFPG